MLSEQFKKRQQVLAGLLIKESNTDNNTIEVSNIAPDELDEIMSICDKVIKYPGFEDVCSKDPRKRIQSLYDPKLSFKVTYNGKIVGFNFLSAKEILHDFLTWALKAWPDESKRQEATLHFDQELLEELKPKRGVQCVAVGVLEEFRGLGVGRKIMDKPKELGFDYLWAVQTNDLSNVTKWLSRGQHLVSFKWPQNQKFDITIEKY